jgi:hypothetical protein
LEQLALQIQAEAAAVVVVELAAERLDQLEDLEL